MDWGFYGRRGLTLLTFNARAHLLKPEEAKDSVGSQHVKCLRHSSRKTKSCKQAKVLQRAAQGPCYCDTREVPIAGTHLCTSLLFQEAVTLFPSKSCPQILAFALYQLILLALQEKIHGSCTPPPSVPALTLNRGSLRICLQCWSLLSLEILWGGKPWEMLDLPLHTIASSERKTTHYSSGQRVKLSIIKLREGLL